MGDMPHGFLNPHAEPRPAWERTLERIEYWTDRPAMQDSGLMLEVRMQIEPIAMCELAFRVIGTEMPMTVDNTEVPRKMLSALERMLDRLEFEQSREHVKTAISWIKRTYL